MFFFSKKKRTMAELHKLVKHRRLFNALSLKIAPCLGLSLAMSNDTSIVAEDNAA
jgi:hypothetical protein